MPLQPISNGKLSNMCLTICDVGSLTGSVILFPIAGLICEYGLDGKGFDGGWPAIFYIFGTLVIYIVGLPDAVTLGGAYDGREVSPVGLQNWEQESLEDTGK